MLGSIEQIRFMCVFKIFDEPFPILTFKLLSQLYRTPEMCDLPELCAKFYRKRENLLFDITPKAIQMGILEPAIVALMFLTEHHGVISS